MRVVMLDAPQSLLDERRRKGIDRFDEVWEGEVHMAPAPNVWHQDFEFELESWLRQFWGKPTGGDVFHEVNVSDREDWSHNFRVPDLVLLLPDRMGILRDTHLLGPPSAIVEIRSPDDESYEKMPFYAKLGVPEVWIIDRDTKAPELYELAEGEYQRAVTGDNGWIASKEIGVEFQGTTDNKFAIRLSGDEASLRELPGR